MARPTLIVPGLHGSGVGHWQDFWRLDHDGTSLVAQADWANPDEATWLATLERAIKAQPDCLLIGHSLGSILIAKLAHSPVARLVRGALLVAPADINRTSVRHHRSYEFGQMPRARLPFPTVVVASRNDPYMPYDKAAGLSGLWGSGFVDLGLAGHINIASGYGRWTDGYGLADHLALETTH